MREMNEKMANQLVDNIESAVEMCNTLAITTGDEEFVRMGLLLITLLVAKTKGDIDALAEAMIPVLSAKSNKNNALEDLKRGINFN
jgi:hypothetical protein